MFGYVRPLKSKFTDDEQARFQAVYCGLCHAIGERYSRPMRLILNYDLAFLSLVLGAFKGDSPCLHARCAAKPISGRSYRKPDEVLFLAADISVILTYYKLSDTVSDEPFYISLPARFLRLVMRKKYKKAAGFRPAFDRTVKERLMRLSEIERQKCPSIDIAADTFAAILSAAAEEADLNEPNRRILGSFFYHIGRWIYLSDAANDLREDMKKSRYNPIALRYSLDSHALSEEIRNELTFTLYNSLAGAASAFELLELQKDREVISDILYFGLRAVTFQVLNGTWRKKENKSP